MHFGEHRAEPHGDFEEAGCLAVDEVVVFLLSDGTAQRLHLQEFAFDHLLGEADEQVEDAEIAFFERDAEGLHVEPVAGENAFGIAPGGIGRRAAAARVGRVDDVVVDQRGRVHHLNDSAEADHAAAGVALGLGREQQQRGRMRLPPPSRRYSEISVMAVDGGNGVVAEFALDGAQIVVEQVEDLFCRRYGQLCSLALRSYSKTGPVLNSTGSS